MAACDEVLAKELGVHAGLVGSFRRDQLEEGTHWTRDEGSGRVDFTEAGECRIRELLAVPEKMGGAGSGSEEAPALPAPVALRVVRLMPNPLWVGVQRPDGGVADVRVRNRGNLRPGTLLQCVAHPDGRWECVHRGLAVALAKMEGGAV